MRSKLYEDNHVDIELSPTLLSIQAYTLYCWRPRHIVLVNKGKLEVIYEYNKLDVMNKGWYSKEMLCDCPYDKS